MAVIYTCKCCGTTHPAPTQLARESSFYAPQMQSHFQNARYRCAKTGEVETYSVTDHAWQDDPGIFQPFLAKEATKETPKEKKNFLPGVPLLLGRAG